MSRGGTGHRRLELSFTWTSTALIQEPIGRWVDRTHSYSAVTFVAGLLPMIGLLALLLLWDHKGRDASSGTLS